MDGVRFLLDLTILLFIAKVFGLVAKRIGVPEVVGQIVAGLLLGPAILNIVTESDFLQQMAEIGVMMIMFEAGLDTNLDEMRKTGIKAAVIAFMGVIVPITLGMVLYMAFYGFAGPGSDQFLQGLFIGTIISATSVSITVAALKELGKLNDAVGTAITGAAIIDDVCDQFEGRQRLRKSRGRHSEGRGLFCLRSRERPSGQQVYALAG